VESRQAAYGTLRRTIYVAVAVGTLIMLAAALLIAFGQVVAGVVVLCADFLAAAIFSVAYVGPRGPGSHRP